MDWLPEAIRENRGSGGTWAEKSDPKGCLHTTEGSGWPTYQGWKVNPHATIMPNPGVGVTVRQHIPFSGSSFALRNLDGGVQTNRDYVFQFELIGTCEKGGPGYYWPGADDAVLLDLFDKVIEPLSKAFGIPLVARDFKAYPSSYGNSSVRMSGAAFDNYSGWLGHQHVPENAHGDPGAFPWDRMIQLVEDRDMPLTDAEIEKIAKKVWDLDYIPNAADTSPSTNPTYAGKNALNAVWGNVRNFDKSASAKLNALQADNAALKATVASLNASLISLREETRASNNSVVQAVQAAIADALATSTVQVDVNVNGKVTP